MTVPWALPLVIAMQARSAGVSPRPVAWAAQSPRPAACLGAPSLWQPSRQASLRRRCRELSRAQALLLRAPDQARALAAALLAEAPELAEARVLRGRAALRLGDGAAALADLSPLLADDAGLLAEPAALQDGGRAALAQGDLQTAARFYRALGGRAAFLSDRNQELTAYIEIAATLLAADAAPVDDVLAYLREARRRSAGSGFSSLCAALTALAWTVEAREAEAQGALGEVRDPDGLAAFERRGAVWLPDGLFHALMGLALERAEPELSARHYRALAEGPLGPTRVGKLSSRTRARSGGSGAGRAGGP